MNFLKSSKIREWERQHKEHSKLCKQCQNLFSSLEALKALTSEQGLSISVKEIFGKTAPACSLCLGLRSNLFHDGFTVAPFDEGGWKGNFRLRAEFDKKALPTTNHPGYPSGILSVVYLSIYPASSQLQSSDAHFITIYRPLDAPPDTPLLCHPQGFDMACDEYMRTAKLQLIECLEMHEKCREGLASMVPLLPTRVIDVGLATNTTSPKLYTNRNNERAHYVCLSYVWGGSQPLTTKNNVVALAEKIASESLSQTAQDAIRVTRKLGIRYLWIDALCIIQDDDDDKKRELRVMGNIYRDATLTISASSSTSAVSGFAKAEPPQGCELPFYLPDGTIGSVVAVPSQLEIPYLHQAPLHSRGWTFQERMLSRRILIFVNSELKWQCPSSSKKAMKSLASLDNANTLELEEWQTTDWGTTDSDDAITFSHALTPAAFESAELDFSHPPLACFSGQRTNLRGDSFWADTVEEYSSRIFTNAEDRLPAIAGIIKGLENSWSDTCVAGLWLSRLVQDLYWKRDTDWRPELNNEDAGEVEGSYEQEKRTNSFARLIRFKKEIRQWQWWENALAKYSQAETEETRNKLRWRHSWKRANLYLAPSWSWFSVAREISFSDTILPTAKVISCSVEAAEKEDQESRLFQLTGGKVVLWTKVLVEPAATPVVSEIFDEPEKDTCIFPRSKVIYAKLGIDEVFDIEDDNTPSQLRNYFAGLILTPAKDGTFQRVGVFKPSHWLFDRPAAPTFAEIKSSLKKGRRPISSHSYNPQIARDANAARVREWEDAEERTIVII